MNSSERVLRVEHLTRETDSIISFTLVDPQGGELPAWEPGAHIDVVVPGLGTRQYSLCGDPRNRHSYRIGVLLEPGGRGGSRYLHTEVRVGDLLTCRGPRNNFMLDEAKHYVFLAGGIGVTPILPMVVEAQRRGASWTMVYGARTRSAMAFVSELHERVQLMPEDELGRIDVGKALADLPEGSLVYCCGPAAMIEAVRGHRSDWPDPDTVRFELFSAPVQDTATETDRAFEVELVHTGATFTVQPGESILQKAMDAGADIGFDCQEGICGSCETPILEGVADHRDQVLTAKEKVANTCMMICVSRAASPRIVLDL
ncbi:PDR/VanB family oxidoreductase [Pseudonocardia kujensis]|uniref:PDR/VanB family oxidoreductase n=1 Tax=Pseudonocardia kujensis TaxID=1128675 RepID=UPI001E5351A0|nr:PDR/VanB family oxidoreductase [Pseudonocardia kujensis]MCE0764606.1 PDR/VanB family oxidoreductase [Pseudonocardia kujensis]